MSMITIHKLGPIQHTELKIDDFMIFTGPQASGKSTIAKSVFFFKNIKNILFSIIRKRYLLNHDGIMLSIKDRLIREIRSNFLQTFGSTWCMDDSMFLEYNYIEDIYIRISLKADHISPNYIWIDFSDKLIHFLKTLDRQLVTIDLDMFDEIRKKINTVFDDDAEIVYIPAGRSMITLLSTQLNFIYSSMDDVQKRSIDYCTQNYLERILQLKSAFSTSLLEMINNRIVLTDEKVDKGLLVMCAELMNSILQGEYRNVEGEERLQVSEERYVKINFASSGQQEAVWILNVLFFYLLNNKKAYFIVEEPESHLFPNAQKKMAEFISLANTNGNQILLTTHSPYILGTINNLLYAGKISNFVDLKKLDSIIKREKWLRFEKLSAYYIEKGNHSSCTDNEFKSIENEVIDGASEDINEDYSKMICLQQNVQEEVE